MKISRRNLIGSGIAATTPGALTAHAKESKDSNEINFDKRAAIICQNNFRHSFSLTWSGKTCDIRRSL